LIRLPAGIRTLIIGTGIPARLFINSYSNLFPLVSSGVLVGGFMRVSIILFAPVFLFLKK
jgi:hypothetical protein